MIDESKTLYIYGYTSDELSVRSGKPIVAICDGCGEYKDTTKHAYRELCRSCAYIKHYVEHPERRENLSLNQKKRYEDPKEHEVMSVVMKKRYEDPKEHEKTSVAMKTFWETPESRENASVAQQKRWEDPLAHEKHSIAVKKCYAEMDDPGEQICRHHYIYDHSDLTKYTTEITRRRHIMLHWNIRKSGITIPHINISGGE